MTEPTTSPAVCASCGAAGTGRFCSSCGASLESATCASCGATLSPGARFCHECGRAVAHIEQPAAAAPVKASTAASLPWIVAAIALVVLLAFLAGSAFNRSRGSRLDAPQNALPQAGLDDRGPSDEATDGAVRAPDISQLSPQERADRLFNRIMSLAGEGKEDSVLFFAPMAISAYQMLDPMNADQRYDLGRIAEVAGALPLAKAQADTILKRNPTHLLGLILAAQVASLDNRAADRAGYQSRLRSAYGSEIAKNLPEYERHSQDIRTALADSASRPTKAP
jgi:hypothetical protein